MVYDSARERVVLFGGYGSNDEDLGDTWEWDGSNWNHRSPATSPPARYGHAMGYDSARGRVVLFGGYSLSLGLLGDTWEWDGSMWIERTPGENPPARYEPAMTYDSGRGRVVLFGGDASISEAQEYLGDTWEWDGSAWVERLPSTGPTVRLGHTMAYDEARGRLVLFGGSSADYEALDDMWEYGPIDSCGHASNVVAFTPGNGTDDNSALATLGAPDSLTVSLGLGGSVELQIDPPVPNGPGADLMVHEIGSFHGGLDDSFRVEVSEDGTVYRSAGDCAGDDCQLDLGGSGLSSARYVRLVDLVPDDGEPAPEAGADIDAVSVVACADCAAEVKGVAAEALGADGLRLSWNAAAGAATYAIIRGQLSTLSATLGDCVAGGLGALMWDDAELPPPGDGFTYLVRGESSVCGPGPLGFGAGGAPRVYTGGACP